MSFADTGLDPRLLRALSKRGLTTPTAVQAAAIPPTLEGKDVVARARTGSGKTLAYLLPALHRILTATAARDASAVPAVASGTSSSFKTIVLVPTRELCEQVKVEAATLAQHCGTDITATALVGETPQQLKRAVASAGQVVIATPGRLAAALQEGFLSPTTLGARLQTMVLDEADLLLSYGYEEDLQLIAPHIPRSCQVMLMSATSSEDVEKLQKLVLHNPVTLNLLHLGGPHSSTAPNTGRGGTSGVSSDIEHFAASVPAADRLLYLMAMLKLGLVRRKALIFVNSVDEGFRVKLFLESFGVRSALLNAELPLNSRSHILATFNKGLFDYLIATDDVHAHTHDSKAAPKVKGGGGFKRRAADATAAKRGGGHSKDEEFGVTRGIDFKGVRTIINYDLPSSVEGYVHRVGRTGRAGEAGIAVSFFGPLDVLFKSELQTALTGEQGAAAAAATASAAAASQPSAHPLHSTSGPVDPLDEEELEDAVAAVQATQVLKPFTRLPASQVEALRYRGEDLARSITKGVIKEARARELRLELLNSDKLKDYFEEHGAEKQLLRHDKALHKAPQPAHLKHIPAYIRDATLIGETSAPGNSGRGALSHKKRKRIDSGQDPLKANDASAFVRAPRKGGAANEQLTDIEMRAEAVGKKEAKKRAKNEVLPVYKSNVKKTTNNFKRR